MQRRHHQLIRFASLVVAGVSLTYMAGQAHVRSDITEAGLSRLTTDTKQLIGSIDEERPVVVHAFVSKEVPREYVAVRSRLLNILREMEASGGPGLTVRIVEPEPHSVAAEEALENFEIAPRPLVDRAGGRIRAMDVFMGLAFVSGPRTQVVPFLDRGLSVEYEVNRALRVVTQDERKVVGILRTDATIMGNFDMQTRSRQPPWQIVDELRKSYEVRSLNAKSAIPDDIDVLIVPQLASCTQEELDHVKAYVDAGKPALLTVDPAPMFDMRLAPGEPKLPPPNQQQQNMFGGPPPGEPKGNYSGFLRELGVAWDDQAVVFDNVNPNPILQETDKEVVFVAEDDDSTFRTDDPAVKDLKQVVFIFAGALDTVDGHESTVVPLLHSSKEAGLHQFDELVDRHPLFGMQFKPRQLRPPPVPVTGKEYTMAARVTTPAGETDRNVVVLSDLDLFGNVFFQLNAQGGDIDGDGLDDVRFDNVQFLLNVVDDLVGEDRFFELRARRPSFRRLTKVDALTEEARAKRQAAVQEANEEAQAKIDEAQAKLDKAVEAIEKRTDLDETTKNTSLASIEAAENRRLQAATEEIEREKAREMDRIDNQSVRDIDAIQNRLRLLALVIPPLPALFLGGFIFWRKRRRERDNIPQRRRKDAKRGVA